MILEENVLKNDFFKNIKFEYFLSLYIVFLLVFWFNMVIKNSLSGRFKLTLSAYKVYPSSVITCVILKYAFFQRTILHLLQWTTPRCVDSWSFKSVVPFVYRINNETVVSAHLFQWEFLQPLALFHQGFSNSLILYSHWLMCFNINLELLWISCSVISGWAIVDIHNNGVHLHMGFEASLIIEFLLTFSTKRVNNKQTSLNVRPKYCW